MNKRAFILMLVCFSVGVGSLSYAEEEQGAAQDPMMGKGMMKGKMGMMKGGMMGMMHRSMVASPDGGVIVLSGNKLMKYDKDLNLAKEAVIPGGDMADMKGMCPMCARMMGSGEKDTGGSAATPEAAADTNHESHH